MGNSIENNLSLQFREKGIKLDFFTKNSILQLVENTLNNVLELLEINNSLEISDIFFKIPGVIEKIIPKFNDELFIILTKGGITNKQNLIDIYPIMISLLKNELRQKILIIINHKNNGYTFH